MLSRPGGPGSPWKGHITRSLLLLWLLGCRDVGPTGGVVAGHRSRVMGVGQGSRSVDSRTLECGAMVVVEVGRRDQVSRVEGLLVMVVGVVHRVES